VSKIMQIRCVFTPSIFFYVYVLVSKSQDATLHFEYRVAKMDKITYLCRSFSTKETCNLRHPMGLRHPEARFNQVSFGKES